MYSLKGKSVMVTGGSGFVGSHLVERLINEKAKVFTVDVKYDRKSYFVIGGLERRSKAVKLDICNYRKTSDLVKKNSIEFIFHLAAQAIVETALSDPKGTIDNNVVSTTTMLEIVRNNPRIRGMVVASSDKAYGKLNNKKYFESDPLAGDHPYDTSKSATDLIATTYYSTYKIPVVVTRFGNIYGEGDLNFSRIIPGIMKSIVSGQNLVVRSNGKFIRDYLYVKDVVEGYILPAKNIEKAKGEAFNFGSAENLDVIQVIKKVEKATGKKIRYKIMNTARNEIPYQSLDYSKIKRFFGWKPAHDITSISKKILAWYIKVMQ